MVSLAGEPPRRAGPAARGRRLAAAFLLASGQLAIRAISAQTSPSMQTNVDHQQEQQRQDGEASAAGLAPPPAPMSPAELKTSFPLYMRLMATLVCLVIFTIGVCGNLLVPLVVIKTRYLRNSTNLFLINLSVADLLVLIVCMPLVLVELHSRPETWLLGESMCKVSNFVEMLAANGSIFTILAISFERYYAICKPLKAGYKCTRLRATIIICLIWLLACILTSPILIMAKSVQTTYIDGSLVDNCILETDSYWPKMYVFVSMFAFFCLPLLVLMLVYWLISRRLIRESIAMTNSTGSPFVSASSPRSGTPPAGVGFGAGLGAGPGACGHSAPTTSGCMAAPRPGAEWRANHISAPAKRCVRDGPLERADVANDGADRLEDDSTSGGQRQRRLQQVSRSLTEDHAPYERTKLVAMHSALAPMEANNRFQANQRQHECNYDSKSAAFSASEMDPISGGGGGAGQEQRNSVSGSLLHHHHHQQQQHHHQANLGARREHSMSKVNLIAMAHNISNNFHIKRAKARSGSQPLVTHHLQASAASSASGAPEQLHSAGHYLSKKHQMDSRRQVVVMLAFVVACFFLLFAPYRVFTIWLILSTPDQVQSLGMETYYNLTYFSRILIYLHSAINPIAYNLISTKFRRAFMSILLCRGPESRRQFTTDTYRHVHEAGTKTNSSRLNSKVNRSSSQNTTHTTSDRLISIRIVDVYAHDHEVNDDLVP